MEMTFEETKALPRPIYIDVRSPIEFKEDHIPGAINIPLFTDEERAIVGIAFREKGLREAVLIGSGFAGNKLEQLIHQFSELVEDGQVIVNCKMGGMRSTSLVTLLRSLDLPVMKLIGGYKAYRRTVRSFFDSFHPSSRFIILHGLAGVGKTKIIQQLSVAIDLERLAGHRSSLFGSFGRMPNSQKMFESLLKNEYEKKNSEKYIVIEGESRKIGNIHIPPAFYSAMQRGINILITAPMESRIRTILEDYSNFDKEKVIEIIEYLENKIGKNNADLLKKYLRNGELESFVQFLLEKYYDPLYNNTIKEIRFADAINCADVKIAADSVSAIIQDCV